MADNAPRVGGMSSNAFSSHGGMTLKQEFVSGGISIDLVCLQSTPDLLPPYGIFATLGGKVPSSKYLSS